MPQEIFTQLERVCQRRSQRRWLAATCWALAAVLVATLVLVGIDRALGIADPLGRGLLTVVFFVSCVLILRRWLGAASQQNDTPLKVAYEVERRHPELRDAVANAWEFSRQADNDLTAGSESLRRATVLRATTSVDEVDWQQLISRKPLRLAAFAIVSVGLTMGLLSWCLPQTMEIGLTRLFNPLSSAEWPRDHDLQFVEPELLLATGEDLFLQLQDTHGALPSTITMHYRTFRQGHWDEETVPLTAQGNSLKILRTNVQESLQYRATGADHQTMPWHALEVVAPPHVEQLSVTVHPPAYTGLPVRILDQGASIYAGSELSLQGITDQPITKVVLLSASGERIEAKIGPVGQSFEIDSSNWRVESSDTFNFQLTTGNGLISRAATELSLDVVADQPPQVRFLEPLQDLAVVPSVALLLVIEANDELSVRDIHLLYQRSDQSDAGQSQANELRSLLWTNGQTETAGVQRQRVEYLWQLEPLNLKPGSVVEVYATASDYQPRTGKTGHPLRLSIVSADELWQQILEQQAHVAEVLAQLLREQRELRGITVDWAELPEWSKTRWANATHAALFRQRQIACRLADGPSSLTVQLARLSQTIERNGLLRPEAVDRLLAIREELQLLSEGPLAAVERTLSKIVRQTQHSSDQDKLRSLIASTARHQEQCLAGLRRAIELLTPGNVMGRLERELAEIEVDQQTLANHCRVEIAPQLFLSTDANPELQTTLASAARRQRGLARRLAEWILNATQASRRDLGDEPSLAARMAVAVALAEELTIQATIQAAADQLARQRLGRSATLQRQVLENLAKLRSHLAGRDIEGAAERFKKLQAAERELQRLRRRVAKFERELSRRSPEPIQRELERFRYEREALAKQAEAMSRQLERLRIPKAAKSANNAASQLRRSKLASKATQQAQQHLENAQRQLTTARRRQQVALARLQMAQLATKLKAFVGIQSAIQQEVLRLTKSQETAGQLNPAQVQSVTQLADRQSALREEVNAQADLLMTLPVFAHLLRKSGETMQTVEVRLQQSELSRSTSSLADEVVQQLKQLAAAVRQERKNLSASSRQGQGGGGEQKAGDTAQGQTLQLALGQMQLLKSLQSALREKTLTLESQHDANQPPTHSASELARQQQQLTELARQLVPEPPDPPTDRLFPNLEQDLEQSLKEITLP